MAASRDDTSKGKSRGNGGNGTKGDGYRELALQLDPELASHPEDMTDAERNSALPWRCQIVRIEEGGELDRALLAYLERWKRRSGRKIPTAVAIRGLLRIALLHTGCIGEAKLEPGKPGRKPKLRQLGLFGPE